MLWRGHVACRHPTQQAQRRSSGSAAEDSGRLRKADDNAEELFGAAETARRWSEKPTSASRPAKMCRRLGRPAAAVSQLKPRGATLQAAAEAPKN